MTLFTGPGLATGATPLPVSVKPLEPRPDFRLPVARYWMVPPPLASKVRPPLVPVQSMARVVEELLAPM